jgi:hypothetical protein
MSDNGNELVQIIDYFVDVLTDDIVQDYVAKIESVIQKEYASGTKQERELASYIRLKYDPNSFVVSVSVPQGITSSGMDALSVIVQREYGSLSQDPNPVILNFVRG